MNEEITTLVEDMTDLMDTKARLKFELKQIEKREEILNVKFIQVLKENNLNEVQLPTCYFGMKIQTRTAFDQKKFSTEHPDLFEQYKETKEKETFAFKLGVQN